MNGPELDGAAPAADGTAPAPRRIGVYVCHCGGNISDYVDVAKVVESVQGDGDVAVARTAMFACSDSSQQEMIEDIQANNLDGLVVASCSPKLHTFTFRAVATRAGLNPYEYSQVNIREQCSWIHSDDPRGATEKAIGLVEAEYDLVVLAVGVQPNSDAEGLFPVGELAVDEFRYVAEPNEDLDPGATSIPGVYVAGAASGAKDIADSILHAGSTAAQVAAHLERARLEKVEVPA